MIFLHVVIHIVHSIVQVVPDDPSLYSKYGRIPRVH